MEELEIDAKVADSDFIQELAGTRSRQQILAAQAGGKISKEESLALLAALHPTFLQRLKDRIHETLVPHP